MSDNINPTREQIAALAARAGGDGPIHMLNMLRFREHAAYEDARAVSGAQAYRDYTIAAAAPFTRVGGTQFWMGRFEQTVIGPTDEHWHLIFIAEYPNVGAFLTMIADPEYQAAVPHRTAAVEDSRLIVLTPQAAGHGFADLIKR
jgi:uncharacterized protein (DUF1330 family)